MYSILIVDDEPLVKITLKSLFHWEAHGFTICGTASDGKEALFLAEKLHPDIIITDLKMPGMDGLQLIEQLNLQHFPGCILVLSNYSDYEYVRQALKAGAADYILKISLNETDLLHQLHQCIHLLKPRSSQTAPISDSQFQELIIRNYLTDPYYSYETFCSHLSLKDPDTYYVCYLSQPGEDTFCSLNGKTISTDFFRLILTENFSYLPKDRIIQLNTNSFIILIPGQKLQAISLSPQDFALQIQQYAMRFLALQLFIMVSKTTYSFGDLKQLYAELKEKEHIAFYSLASPNYIEEIQMQHYINYTDYRTFSTELVNEYLSQGIFEEIPTFDAFILKCIKENIQPVLIKSYLGHVCDYIDIMVASNHFTDQAASIDKCSNVHTLKELMYTYFEKIAGLLKQHTMIYRKEVVQCIQYIHAHYHEDISLDLLSDKIGISKNYLCTIFKADVNVSIVQYINNYRMEQAALLIQKDNVYLKKVAEAVGIHDQFYFNRIFKKTFGMTPSQYKANCTSVGSRDE